MDYKFKNAIAGGTFDRFHRGHKALLTAAFHQSEKVTIGIATDALFNHKKFAQVIENYDSRKQSILAFLKQKKFADRAEIMPIHDIYGNSLSDEKIDAIFVTEKTKPNALKINEERKKMT